jgi:hypothetical protein
MFKRTAQQREKFGFGCCTKKKKTIFTKKYIFGNILIKNTLLNAKPAPDPTIVSYNAGAVINLQRHE